MFIQFNPATYVVADPIGPQEADRLLRAASKRVVCLNRDLICSYTNMSAEYNGSRREVTLITTLNKEEILVDLPVNQVSLLLGSTT